MRSLSFFNLFFLVLCLTGCALHYPDDGIHYAGARTLSSTALVAFPVPAGQRNLYLRIHGKVDQPTLIVLQNSLVSQLRQKGYYVVSAARSANYVIDVNVIYIGPATEDAAQDVLLQGYDAPAWPAGAIAVGKRQYLNTAPKSNFSYMMVADLDIISAGTTRRDNVYRTRLVSEYPNGLKFETFKDAKPVLIQGVARFVSSIF